MTGAPAAPLFSVIVPTHNRLDSLRRTLESVRDQTLPAESREIIVCDDGSTDGTSAFLAAAGPDIRVVTQANRGAAAARNAGIEIARGTFLAFTDDDCVVPPTWLATFERLFGETGADLIGGSAENELCSEMSQLYQEMAHHLYQARNLGTGRPEYLCTNNLACRRAMIARAGPFDTRFFVGGEDREFAMRTARAGGQIHFAPELRVRHAHVFSFGSFLRHAYRMGQGAYLLHRILRTERGGSTPGSGPAPYVSFVRRLLRHGPTPRALMRVGLFGMSQASTAIAFGVQWARDRPRGAA